ncbi:Membrane bound L-sorbosone dehydrogenase [Rubripirellula amarantea]|uniref:Membrane bound L-sorbosone dehydrogenase n=1 Tax=Rubripirellula amarantea TaxID=2527999 RepID=A0A5C5WIX1_9BACT|nr:PVC-type heme-binding CxxCH protein [Rubripirellula amarantea]TWT50776.1 Membrane bound L-sorbosone dehydrogenase [Rubripirellula amarantea]
MIKIAKSGQSVRRIAVFTLAMTFSWLAWPNVILGQNDLQDIPTPDPVSEMEMMNLAEGASVNLFAADPDIRKPIQMNFDCEGGLWVASSEVYPQIQPGEVANDKIIVVRDTNGDGQADSQTVFADGLLIPTGVLPDGPHAAYVVDSTQLLYLTDTDHDGRADQRKVIISGFGTEDTHHLVHTLRYGPDGCVYFNQSIYIHSHIDTPDGTRHLDGGGIWRFRPETNELEVICKGFINPWGHQFDAYGESFVTDGAYFEGINYAFPDSVFATSPGATRWLTGLNPGSPKHCGLEILSGTHIPPAWSGTMVTNDFRSHRVCRFDVRPSASGYVSRQQPEVITTPHVAFRPIDARMGPDGAIYIADWYNPIIQHGEVDFRDERRDRKHGRIWRVSFPRREADPWPEFSALPTDSLVALLEDPALPVRQFARQQLWKQLEVDAAQVMKSVRSWVNEKPGTRLIELLWINESLDAPEDADLASSIDRFESVDARYQRTVLRSLYRNREKSAGADLRQQIESFALSQTSHANAAVRLEAVVIAGQLDGIEALNAVVAAAGQDVDGNLDFAIWQSARSIAARHPSNSSILADAQWKGRERDLAKAITAIGDAKAAQVGLDALKDANIETDVMSEMIRAIASSANADQLGRLAKTLVGHPAGKDQFDSLIARTQADGTKPAGIADVLSAAVPDVQSLVSNPHWASKVAKMIEVWKVVELESVITPAINEAGPDLQSQLIAALGSLDSQSARTTIQELAKSDQPEIQFAAVKAMLGQRPRMSIPAVLTMLQSDETLNQGLALFDDLINRKGLPTPVAAEIQKRTYSANQARAMLAKVQAKGGDAGLESAIRNVGNLEDAAWKLSPELSQKLVGEVKSSGNPHRGEQIYRRSGLQCITCHAIGSAGGLVGPNLISIGGSAQVDYIIESLLDPSAKLKEGYTTLSVLTDEGQLHTGIAIGETPEAILLRLADGKEISIPLDSIEDEKPGKSLMPLGLVDTLTQSELVDLTAFLSALGREPEFTVSTKPLVQSWETLVYTNEANRVFNRTSTDSVASDDPIMQWRPITSLVDGTLPISELDRFQQHRTTPPTSFVRFNLVMPEAGTMKVALPSTMLESGLDAWLDGKPTPVSGLVSKKLDAGTHTIIFGIYRDQITSPFAVEVNGDATLP